ncbi:hypothetical protein [Escherichia coli]|uniref:hypothetical protein n=1 Tax=Escherichia coli TaxID=562 RepID=UPI00115B9DE8
MSNEDKLRKKSTYDLLVELSQRIEADIEENGTNYDALYIVMRSWEEEAQRQKETINRLRVTAGDNKEKFGKLKEHNRKAKEKIEKLKSVYLESEKEKQNLKIKYERAKKRIKELEKISKEDLEYYRRDLDLNDQLNKKKKYLEEKKQIPVSQAISKLAISRSTYYRVINLDYTYEETRNRVRKIADKLEIVLPENTSVAKFSQPS